MTPLHLIIPPGGISENIPDEINCHLVKPVIHQMTPLHVLFLQTYTCISNPPVLFPLPPPPGDVGTLQTMYGKIWLIYTHSMPHTLGTLHQVYTSIAALGGEKWYQKCDEVPTP